MTLDELKHSLDNKGIEPEAEKRFEDWWKTYQTDDMVAKDTAREIYYAGFLHGYDEGQYS